MRTLLRFGGRDPRLSDLGALALLCFLVAACSGGGGSGGGARDPGGVAADPGAGDAGQRADACTVEPFLMPGDPCTRCACGPGGEIVCGALEVGTLCAAEDCCVQIARCLPCPDGEGSCPKSGFLCTGTPSKRCDDDNACTDDEAACVDGDCKCIHAALADEVSCVSDPNACTAGDRCKDGACVPGPPVDPDDGNPCTVGVCVKGSIEQKPLGGPCNDGDVCTGGDRCVLGQCVPDNLVSCPEPECASATWCDPDRGGCVSDPSPDGSPCAVSDPCAVRAECQGGACVDVDFLDCDDGNPCTTDTCAEATGGCVHAPKDDGDACAEHGACDQGSCVIDLPPSAAEVAVLPVDPMPGAQLTCSLVKESVDPEGEPVAYAYRWTVDGQDAGVGGATVPSGVAGGCQLWACFVVPTAGVKSGPEAGASARVRTDSGLPPTDENCAVDPCTLPGACDDGNACTEDLCDKTAGCSHDALDGTPCDDDDEPCTTDVCATGTCAHVPAEEGSPCDDGSLCTAVDWCVDAVCTGLAPLDCGDGNPCVTVACDPAKGCVETAVEDGTSCDDGDPCTVPDTCEGGLCKLHAKKADWLLRGSSDDRGRAVAALPGGGYVVAGETSTLSSDDAQTDGWLVRFGAQGEWLSSRRFASTGQDSFSAVTPRSEGGVVMAGSTVPVAGGTRKAWVVAALADGIPVWEKTFGGQTDGRANGIARIGGGYLVAGERIDPGSGQGAAWLLWLDGSGALVSERLVTGAGPSRAMGVTATSDGGAAVVGTASSAGGSSKIWLLRLDASGTKLWESFVVAGEGESQEAAAVVQAPGGGFLVVGRSTPAAEGGSSDLLAVRLDALGATKWTATHGGPAAEAATAVLPASGGGYLVTGWTESSGAGGRDAWVLRIDDAAGAVVWSRTRGEPGRDQASGIAPAPSGGGVVAGSTTATGSGDLDLWAFEILPDGGHGWAHAPRASDQDDIRGVVATADGGTLAVGSTRSMGRGEEDAWVLRLDPSGSILWERTFVGAAGGAFGDSAWAVVGDGGGGFVVAGQTAVGQKHDVWVFGLDGEGQLLWQQQYDGQGSKDWARGIARTAGGYYVAGYLGDTIASPPRAAWLLRLGEQGGLVWQKSFLGVPLGGAAVDVVATADGGAILVTDTAGLDVRVIRVTAAGDVIWDQTFGGTSIDRAAALAATPDGGVVMAGWTLSAVPGKKRAWVIRLSGSGAVKWDRSYALAEQATSAVALPGGDLIVGAWTNTSTTRNDQVIFRLDGSGEVVWSTVVGGAQDDRPYAVALRPGGAEVVVAGVTASRGPGDFDGWVFPISVDGLACVAP